MAVAVNHRMRLLGKVMHNRNVPRYWFRNRCKPLRHFGCGSFGTGSSADQFHDILWTCCQRSALYHGHPHLWISEMSSIVVRN